MNILNVCCLPLPRIAKDARTRDSRERLDKGVLEELGGGGGGGGEPDPFVETASALQAAV